MTVSTRGGRILGAPVLRSAAFDVRPRGMRADRRLQAEPAAGLTAISPRQRPLRAFHDAYEDRFAATYGDWRRVIREVADKFPACGVLAPGHGRLLGRSEGSQAQGTLALEHPRAAFEPRLRAEGPDGDWRGLGPFRV